MNNTDKLLFSMKSWLMLHPDHQITILGCFEHANHLDRWRVEMFYVHFAPHMARVLDAQIKNDKG